MHALCAEPKFVAFLDNMDAWLVLLPMLAAPADLMGASLQVFQRCVAVSNHPSSAVAELGGTEDLVNAALTCRAGANQDAAFAVMRACSDIPVFLNSLKVGRAALPRRPAFCVVDELMPIRASAILASALVWFRRLHH